MYKRQENVTWFSNEEGKKGRIEAGQLADLIVPDRDYFSCAETDIADLSSELTMVGGRVVWAAGDFARFNETELPPAMPDWSPVGRFGGYAAWGEGKAKGALARRAAQTCGCGHGCAVPGHAHAGAWSSRIPAGDLQSFWGALGCSCWAV